MQCVKQAAAVYASKGFGNMPECKRPAGGGGINDVFSDLDRLHLFFFYCFVLKGERETVYANNSPGAETAPL